MPYRLDAEAELAHWSDKGPVGGGGGGGGGGSGGLGWLQY